MAIKPAFLRAEWKELIMANYLVTADILQPFVPAGTELDHWNGNLYVSLVGFQFLETRIMGIKVPFHVNFPEVNLRFYVRYNDQGTWKRGVVFIKEIVPKAAITFVANTIYQEHYATHPMRSHRMVNGDSLEVVYEWKHRGNWNRIAVSAVLSAIPIAPDSEAAFITEHYWGYTNPGGGKTSEYGVEHPVWEQHALHSYDIRCDFEKLYGGSFAFLDTQDPHSVFMAKGSEVVVRSKRKL
jgi:uncharacterized protein